MNALKNTHTDIRIFNEDNQIHLDVIACQTNEQHSAAYYDKQLIFFDKKRDQPAIGKQVSVMLVCPYYTKRNKFNKRHLRAIITREITDEHALIEYSNFELAKGQTLPKAKITGIHEKDAHLLEKIENIPLILQGRSESTEGTFGKNRKAYVLKSDLLANLSEIQIEGLTSVHDAKYAHMLKK